MPDFTQLASDGKQYAYQPLNERFSRVAESSLIHHAAANSLNAAYRAVQGIATITQILIANSVAKDNDEDAGPLKVGHEHGLLVAVQALSEYVSEDIDRIADWSLKYAPENANHA